MESLTISRGISSPVNESRVGNSPSPLRSPPFEYRVDDVDTLEKERCSDMEQELYKFYESLSEKAFDLSMTDLVVCKPVCATDGLPVENTSASKYLKFHSPTRTEQPAEVTCCAKKKLSDWLSHTQKSSPNPSPDRPSGQESIELFPSQLPQFVVSKSSPTTAISRSKAAASDNCTALSRSLSSKSHRKQSARISPKITPMSSPRSSSASANYFPNGVNISAPRNSVSPSGRHKNPGIKMDANNQCSVCSSYTHFFKSRCEVCGRIYCSYCMQEAVVHMPNGTRCRGVCAERTSIRSCKKPANSCWPFRSRKFMDDDV